MAQLLTCTNKVKRSAVGINIILNLKDCSSKLDLTTQTKKDFIFERPDGTIFVKTATLVGSAEDGKLQYTTEFNDLDQVGYWKVEADVKTTIFEGRSETVEFEVIEGIGFVSESIIQISVQIGIIDPTILIT